MLINTTTKWLCRKEEQTHSRNSSGSFNCSTCITEVLDRCSCCHHLLVEQNAIKSVEICNSSIGFSPSYTFTFYSYALPKIFECVAYIHLHKNQRTKLDPCVVHCAFLSYATHKNGYRCYDPVTRCLYVSMNVTYLEHEFFFQKPISYSVLQGRFLMKNRIETIVGRIGNGFKTHVLHLKKHL